MKYARVDKDLFQQNLTKLVSILTVYGIQYNVGTAFSLADEMLKALNSAPISSGAEDLEKENAAEKTLDEQF